MESRGRVGGESGESGGGKARDVGIFGIGMSN